MKVCRRKYEFSAHEFNVNCLRLGRGTGVGLVTGGDDHKVKLWKLGHSKPVVSLKSDPSPIDSVSFDASDEYAVSGNRDGCVTIWDIPREKAGRKLLRHASRVTSVQYHPSKGYYVVSGSADSVVKVWDVRRKSCIYSFKGDRKETTQTCFSPDGKWICAGYSDGEVRLWDIRSRKLLERFREHRSRISGIEFHPMECLMATSSFDGTVRLWDIENSETVEKIGPENGEVRCIEFSLDGECLLSALPDGLRVHGWEPYQLHESLSVPWSHVSDMTISRTHKKMVVCTSDQTRVGVWLVDLKRLRPFLQTETKKDEDRSRKMTSTIPSLKMDPVFDSRDSDNSSRTSTSGRYSDKYRALGTERSTGSCCYSKDPVAQDTDKYSGFSTERSSSSRFAKDSATIDSDRMSAATLTDRTHSNPQEKNSKSVELPPVQRSVVRSHSVETPPPAPRPSSIISFTTPPNSTTASTRGSVTTRTCNERKPMATIDSGCDRYGLKTERHVAKKEESYTSRDINVEAFLPKKQPIIQVERPDKKEPDDTECIDDMMSKKDMVRSILSTRTFNLQIVRRFWEQGNCKETLQALHRCQDVSAAVDFVGAIGPLQKIVTLDMIPCFVPLLLEMFQSSIQSYWTTGLNILLLVLKTFGGLIRETINGVDMRMGPNISLEQRVEKCRSAQESLSETVPYLEKLITCGDSFESLAKDAQCRISDLTT